MPTKAKGVGERGTYDALLGGVEGEVQLVVQLGIVREVVDRGGTVS